MIKKFALVDIDVLTAEKSNSADNNPTCIFDCGSFLLKTAGSRAASKITIEPGSDKAKILEAEIKKHPTALFFRAKAIEADKPNSNGDYFSEEEILKSYKSFEGVPFFTNHENQDIEKAKGKIIFAEWNSEEKAVYTLAFVDREAYPHICRSIEEGYASGVSMGAAVEHSICNICGNDAEKTEDYCTHIRDRKGRKFSGKARDVKTGEMKEFKDQIVFEYNYGLKFIELSAVVDPACPTCRIQGVIPNVDYLKKAANIENSLRLIKTSAIEKKASQEEIQQIEQALDTLETIAINLIKNRKQVEVEFASDLVKILSDLQTWADELMGAGYGNVQSNVPGTEEGTTQMEGTGGNEGAPALGEEPPLVGEESNAPAPTTPTAQTPAPIPSPIAQTKTIPTATEEIGKVTGSPTGKSVKNPQLPITAPIRPKSEKFSEIVKLSNKIMENLNKNGEDNMAKRRTLSEKEQQKERTKQILSESWQEKQQFFEYIKEVPSLKEDNCKLSVRKSDDTFVIVAESEKDNEVKVWTFENLDDKEKEMIKQQPQEAARVLLNNFKNKMKLEGDSIMSENIKQAGVNAVNSPDAVQEKQLGTGDLGRKDNPQHSTTQKQLEEKRKGEQDSLTEKQLDDTTLKVHPRTEDTPNEITNAQLADTDGRGENVVLTEKQLAESGNQTKNEQNVITEKQLNTVDTPWARQSNADNVTFKTAGEHMDSVLNVMAETAIETGATPDELQVLSREMVTGTKSRVDLLANITAKPESTRVTPISQRIAFWANKNVKISSTPVADVEKVIINKLQVIASDKSINPEILVEAIDLVGEDSDVINAMSERIDQKLKDNKNTSVKASIKSEMKSIFAKKEIKKDVKEEHSEKIEELTTKRESERKTWEKTISAKVLNPEAVGEADTMIETTFKELGSQKNSPTFKKDLYNFAKGALASSNVKLASITNVTISGDTIQIAVQTDAGEESVEIPIGEENSPIETETPPEGDLTGEGLENTLGTEPTATPPVPTTPAPTTGAPALASNKKNIKTAQVPTGGAVPGPNPGGTAPSAGGANSAGTPPQAEPIESLMTGEPEGAEEEDTEIPTVGEKQMPWTICPECGSADVDVTSEEDGSIKGNCNACGAAYDALIKKLVEFTIRKPTTSKGEEGEKVPEAPAGPELPALPVAAQTKITKDSLIRIAKNKTTHGHVCPSCGTKNCKVNVDKDGHTECVCASCKTNFTKDIIVNAKNAEDAYLTVAWELIPDKNCKECVKKAAKFASNIKIAQMIKTAADNKEKFPMANCIERIAREYGGDTVASFGPCKGKVLAGCVCNQLQKLGLSKIRHLVRLAAASMQKDPMEECIEDQKKQGYTIKEASSICNCIKQKHASENSDNIFVHAYSDDVSKGKIDLSDEDLENLPQYFDEENAAEVDKDTDVTDEDLDNDIGDDLPELNEIDVEVDEAADCEGIKCEKCEKCCDKACKCEDKCTCDSDTDDLAEETDIQESVTLGNDDNDLGNDIEGDTDMLSEKDLLASSSRVKRVGESNLKLAAKPKKVEDIEGNVEAKVPRSKGAIGNESTKNIDVPMATPKVPRGKATMGNEGPDNIDVKADLPDVPVDSAYMGKEKETQKGMPAINNEIKGTVIAETNKNKKEAKKLKEVTTIENDVEAKVPRGSATIGGEGKDNIDVPMATPKVPRSKATMGEEGPDNIDVKTQEVDVPVDNSYMGDEKEAQKNMPPINDEYLKNVAAKRQTQLDRITTARREVARDTAAWLASNGRIESDKETFNHVVTALSHFEIDKITEAAEKMFPAKKITTAKANPNTHAIPSIVIENKENKDDSLTQKLASNFTIGNKNFDNNLTIYGEK